MPNGQLPAWMYMRYLAWRAWFGLAFLTRVAVVATCWFLVVPHVTLRIWRSYIQTGDWLAETILRVPVATLDRTVVLSSSTPWHPWIPMLAQRVVEALMTDWLRSVGLLLALLVLFLGLFFLREYIAGVAPLVDEAPAAQGPVVHDEPDEARRQLRAAALAAAQARAEQMLAANPMEMLQQDVARAAVQLGEQPPPRPAQDTPQDPVWLVQGEGAGEDDEDDAWEDEPAPPAPALPAPAAPAPPAPELAPLRGPELPADDPDAPDEELEGDEEWEENPEHLLEDLDSILHAIGLRGTWLAFAQNVFVFEMLAIMTMSICVAVPYGIGRILGLRVYDAVLLPAKGLRMLTDPVFELLLDSLTTVVPTPRDAAPVGPLSSPWEVHPVLSWVYGAGTALDALTRGDHLAERALCAVLGHLYVVLFLSIEARFGHIVHGGQTQWASTLVFYYATSLKVVFFFVMDMLVFPLYCGFLMDWCLMPLFEGASFAALVGQAQAAPLTFTFCRWATGTMYMFFFAQFVSAIRSVVRPGVVCWMRDSSDPDFHPVKDILERRTLEQLHKMADSAVIYGALAGCVLGVGLRVLRLVPGLLPLYWAPLTPRTMVPVELLLVHFVLRVAIKRARLTYYSRRLFRRWWIWAAKQVRMSAFLMGDDQLDEQERCVYRTWGDWARSFIMNVEPLRRERDGGFARVPANDRPPTQTSILIRTDAAGTPIDEKNQELLTKQLAALDKMETKAPYTIVYIPSHLRLRIVSLLLLLIAMSMGVVMLGLGGPLALGRMLAYALDWAPLHDMYTILHGYVLLGVALLLVHGARGLWPRGRVPAQYKQDVSHGVRGTLRFLYFLVTMGGLAPLLTGLVLYQYLLPSPTAEIPTFSAWYAWALGALVLNTGLLLVLTWMPDTFAMLWTVYNQIQSGVLWRIPVGPATRVVVAPTLGGLVAALVAPYLLAVLYLAMTTGFHVSPATQWQCVRYGNVTILGGAVMYAAWYYILNHLDYWTNVLRDELFLESTELCNYTNEKAPPASSEFGTLPDSVVRAPHAPPALG